jgi:hypothetical protein
LKNLIVTCYILLLSLIYIYTIRIIIIKIGAGWITNEHEPISSIPYFQDAAKRKDDPQFVLVRKDGPYYKVFISDFLTQFVLSKKRWYIL